MKCTLALLAVSLGLATLSCGHPTAGDSQPAAQDSFAAPSTQAVFSVAPVNVPEYGTLTPLGHIQPVGHVLSTDHVYYYANSWDHPIPQDTMIRPVYAPGDGVVTWML